MKLRALLAIAAVGLLAVAAAPAPDGEPGDLTEDGYTIVGIDRAGDWGGGTGAEAGDAMGQDLTHALLGLVPDAEEPTVRFTIGLNSLPPNGGMPEITRYTWNFIVDDLALELDGKWTNYSRGTCDPTASSCPNQPQPQEFLIRGNCGPSEELSAANFTACEEFARVIAEFDVDAAEINIDVPAELIEAGPCSVIKPGANLFGGSVSAAPAAFATSSAFPMDAMFVDADFQLPSADGTPCPAPEDD